MIVENIVGNIKNFNINGRQIDYVGIEWYEVNKKIMKKKSEAGEEIGIRLKEGMTLKDGDILWVDNGRIIAVDICECDAICLIPRDMEEMGKVCYEIGNRHIPMFLNGVEVVIPFDQPIYDLLEKSGLRPVKLRRKLKNALRCKAHAH